MISIDSYKQLVIEEKENYYSIKFIDNKDKIKIIKFFKKEVEIDKMIKLLQLYLKLYKVNGFNHLIPVYSVGNNINSYPAAFLDNGTKRISIKAKPEFFRIISKMILDNYTKNRDKILNDNDIEVINLNAMSNSSQFSVIDNIVDLTLDADLYMNIRGSEKQFIVDLLEYKCLGKEIIIELSQEKDENKRKYIATCGDFKLIFPKGYTYSIIIGIINEHNGKINKTRKRR